MVCRCVRFCPRSSTGGPARILRILRLVGVLLLLKTALGPAAQRQSHSRLHSARKTPHCSWGAQLGPAAVQSHSELPGLHRTNDHTSPHPVRILLSHPPRAPLVSPTIRSSGWSTSGMGSEKEGRRSSVRSQVGGSLSSWTGKGSTAWPTCESLSWLSVSRSTAIAGRDGL